MRPISYRNLHCVDVVADLFVLEIGRELLAEDSQRASIGLGLGDVFVRRGGWQRIDWVVAKDDLRRIT